VGAAEHDCVNKAPGVGELAAVSTSPLITAQSSMTPEDLREAQQDDDDVRSIIHFLQSGQYPSGIDSIKDMSDFAEECPQHYTILDTLCRKTRQTRHWLPKVVVPRQVIATVVATVHCGVTGGHMCRQATLNKLTKRVYFPQMTKTVKDFVARCETCSARKQPRRYERPPLMPHATLSYTWAKVQMDTKSLSHD